MYLLIANLAWLVANLATVFVLSWRKREKSAISEAPFPIIPGHSAYAVCRRHLNSHILALRKLYCQGTAEDLQLGNSITKFLVRNCLRLCLPKVPNPYQRITCHLSLMGAVGVTRCVCLES